MFTYYILSVLSILLYNYSFFPVSISSGDEVSSNNIEWNVTHKLESTVDRLVLIVIDALRYDFITAERMPYLSEIIDKYGCLVKVKVESPTVTLPRIKALTTGSVPQFIDVILNLISSESLKDSFLHRAKANGKKVVFYGDDTWLKIYPNLFTRYEGTSSFFVNDFFEVDYNVTRNVLLELERDWDIMILHYLGLDHIGHIHGPFSRHVPSKLKEMDNIIETIHKKVSKNALIAVTGDHGMKDSGGHGGTSYSETRVPLALSGVKCLNDFIEQVDIPTIFSALLGLEFPLHSIGKISSKLLQSLDRKNLLFLYYYNVMSLQSKSDLCENFNLAKEFHENFLKNVDDSKLLNESIELYKGCLEELSLKLIKDSVQQYQSGLLIGLSSLIFALVSSLLYVTTQSNYKIKFKDNGIIFLLVLFAFVVNVQDFFSLIFILLIFTAVLYQIFIGIRYVHIKFKYDLILFLALSVLHGISLCSSSFIEEEHQIWYFFLSSLFLINFLKGLNLKFYSSFINLSAFVLFRIIRKLNQTGDKFASLPDISQFLTAEENFIYLCSIHSIGLFLIWIYCCKIRKVNNYYIIFTLSSIFALRLILPDNSYLGKFCWCLILLNFLLLSRNLPCVENFVITWILVCALLMKPHNTIIIPFAIYVSSIFSKLYTTKETFVMSHLCLGNALYFCQGHSNSLASINIASGFVGLSEYVPIIVVFQVLCHTYSFPILTHLLILRKFKFNTSWNLIILNRLWTMTVIIIISFILRNHLFIWSVFAPKLLIESCHSLTLFIEILLYYLIIKFNCYLKIKS